MKWLKVQALPQLDTVTVGNSEIAETVQQLKYCNYSGSLREGKLLKH